MVALKPKNPAHFSFPMRSGSRNAVVALKQTNSKIQIGIWHRSRNAVVALKPFLLFGWIDKPGEKQERRGGIETAWVARQQFGAQAGSRNAVVALKPQRGSRAAAKERTKQERRGGIETEGGGDPREIPLQEAGTPWWH